jgi:hypothetical protein
MSSIWQQKATSGGGDFEVPPAGTHPARQVAVVDLGEQPDTYQGKDRGLARKLFYVWELVGCRAAGSTHNHLVGRDYTLSAHVKSALRQMLERWRGSAYAEGSPIDFTEKLGWPCLLTIAHKQAASGNTYARIESVGPPMNGQQVPPPERTPFCWAIADGGFRLFTGGRKEPIGPELPPEIDGWVPYLRGEKTREVIESSPQWKQWVGPKQPPADGVPAPQQQAPAAAPAPVIAGTHNDTVPF